MRTSSVNVIMRLQIPINKPDNNGVMYTEDAIKKAYENIKDLPIIQYNDGGFSVPVGTVTDGYYENGVATVNGYVWFGGSECEVLNSHKDNGITVIDEFKIKGFGICE